MEKGLWSVKCRVWSVKFGVGRGVSGVKCGV